MMGVVGKSTCSGLKTGLYISYHGRIAVRYIKLSGYFMENGRISGDFSDSNPCSGVELQP